MSRRRDRKRRQAIINFVIAGLAIAIIGWAVYALRPPPYDQETLCIVSEEMPPHTAIIIDKTDSYSREQADLIALAIRRTQRGLEVGERLTLFELDASGRFNPRGEFSLCNPGRGTQVNPLFRNPNLIEERYKRLFETPLEAVVEDLIDPKEAPASPILESLARLSQTETFSEAVPRRRVVIISDMLQNSDIFSAYGGADAVLPDAIPPAREVATLVERRFGPGLDGVDVEIRLIPRSRFVDLQRGALEAYWNDVFADLGVRVTWRDL
jgi:hypothetical protein